MGVDDDLVAGQAGVAIGSVDLEPARRVDGGADTAGRLRRAAAATKFVAACIVR